MIAWPAAEVSDDIFRRCRVYGPGQLQVVAEDLESPPAQELGELHRLAVGHVRSRGAVDKIAAQLVTGHGPVRVEESLAERDVHGDGPDGDQPGFLS